MLCNPSQTDVKLHAIESPGDPSTVQCYDLVEVGLLGSAKSFVDSQSEKSVVTDIRKLFDQIIEQLILTIYKTYSVSCANYTMCKLVEFQQAI